VKIDPQTDFAQLVLRLQNGQRQLAYAVLNAIVRARGKGQWLRCK
jgi:hypothetical protein